MVEKPQGEQHEAPAFVPDEATSAGPEKPAVNPDDGGEAPDARESRAPDSFEVDDAVTETAVDPPAGNEGSPTVND